MAVNKAQIQTKSVTTNEASEYSSHSVPADHKLQSVPPPEENRIAEGTC